MSVQRSRRGRRAQGLATGAADDSIIQDKLFKVKRKEVVALFRTFSALSSGTIARTVDFGEQLSVLGINVASRGIIY